MRTVSGQVHYCRIYDVGNEIHLQRAEKIMAEKSEAARFRFRKINRHFVVREAPLVFSLSSFEKEILGEKFTLEGVGKVWDFGALSIVFKVQLPDKFPVSKLIELGNYLDTSEEMNELALNQAMMLCENIHTAIDRHAIWEEFEDLIIYDIHEIDDGAIDFSQILEQDIFYRLILGEVKETLGKDIKQFIKNNSFQYTPHDLTVIDWNSAFVFDREDHQDICDVIEFANCQLFELRYYNNLLDNKLNELYTSIVKKRTTIFSNRYKKLAGEASLKYMEISDIVEKVENSLSIVGDFYYARIYRSAIDRFRLSDWQSTVDTKLNNLAEVSKLYQGEINEKRNQLMEFIIIILIAIEVIPFLWNYFKQFI